MKAKRLPQIRITLPFNNFKLQLGFSGTLHFSIQKQLFVFFLSAARTRWQKSNVSPVACESLFIHVRPRLQPSSLHLQKIYPSTLLSATTGHRIISSPGSPLHRPRYYLPLHLLFIQNQLGSSVCKTSVTEHWNMCKQPSSTAAESLSAESFQLRNDAVFALFSQMSL